MGLMGYITSRGGLLNEKDRNETFSSHVWFPEGNGEILAEIMIVDWLQGTTGKTMEWHMLQFFHDFLVGSAFGSWKGSTRFTCLVLTAFQDKSRIVSILGDHSSSFLFINDQPKKKPQVKGPNVISYMSALEIQDISAIISRNMVTSITPAWT